MGSCMSAEEVEISKAGKLAVNTTTNDFVDHWLLDTIGSDNDSNLK